MCQAVPVTTTISTALGARYWRLWGSSGLSNLADGVLKVLLPLVAVAFTRDPVAIAGMSIAASLPWLVFALPAGAVIDRIDRRTAMLAANGLRAALIAAVAIVIWSGAGSMPVLYALAVAVGIAEVVYDTAAQSILPQLVAPAQLSKANGRLYAVELTANSFVGPPLGGLIIAAGAALGLLAPSALWLLALALLATVRGSFRVERSGPRTSIAADIGEGLRFLGRHRLLRTLAIMTGIFNFASSAVFAVFVLYAVGPESAMGLSEGQYGLLLTAFAIGSLIGSFIAERIERAIGRRGSLAVGVVTGAVSLAVLGLTTNPWIIAAGNVVAGVGVVLWNVIVVSMRQRITPPGLLGRINSTYRLLAWGTMPLGALVGGLLADAFGLPPVFIAMGLVTLALLAFLVGLGGGAMDDPAEPVAEAVAEPAGSGDADAGTADEAAGAAAGETPAG